MAVSAPGESVQAREKILGTAARMFAELGYQKTSLSRVASEAKVSKALIFWHFENKEGLYRRALSKTLEPYFINIEALEGLGEREQISRLLDFFCTFTREHVYSVRFFLSLALGPGEQDDESVGRVLELHRLFRARLTEIIERGRLTGVFRKEIAPPQESALIMASLTGMLIEQFLEADPPGLASEALDYLKSTTFQRLSV